MEDVEFRVEPLLNGERGSLMLHLVTSNSIHTLQISSIQLEIRGGSNESSSVYRIPIGCLSLTSSSKKSAKQQRHFTVHLSTANLCLLNGPWKPLDHCRSYTFRIQPEFSGKKEPPTVFTTELFLTADQGIFQHPQRIAYRF